jgi:SAM-dependent methyltransferase
MSAYQGFSLVYDSFMQDAPYEQWETWLRSQFHLEAVSLADIGCGTGRLTLSLATKCRAILGVDKSEEMLAQAAARAIEEKIAIPWLCQDMRDVLLPHPVDVVVSTCDCLNYLLTKSDLSRCFQRVADSLTGRGWFCFDVLGPQRLRALAEGFWYDLQPEAAILFETSVDSDANLIQYEVHAFLSDDSGLYRRVEEHHQQAFHEREGLIELLEQSGFTVRAVMGDFGQSPLEDSDRWVFVAQKRD